MERITSFCIDHDRLKKGLYLSRIDGDAVPVSISYVGIVSASRK